MSATYTNNPAQRPIDAVRFLAKDHVEGAMKVSDEEIEFLLAQEANQYLAAAAVVDQMAERFVRSKTVGDLTLSYNVSDLAERAAQLRMRGASGIAVPSWGLADTNAEAEDRYFTKGQFDHPSAQSVR